MLQELRAVEDEPAQKVMLELRRRHYPDPWGRPAQGDLPAIEATTIDDVRAHFQRTYQPGGTILGFATTPLGETVPVPISDLWKDEVTLTFSYAASGDDLATALELIRSRRIRVADMISHRLPLAETAHGFALTATAADSLKVVILPQK